MALRFVDLSIRGLKNVLREGALELRDAARPFEQIVKYLSGDTAN
jgi:hypothetical protein